MGFDDVVVGAKDGALDLLARWTQSTPRSRSSPSTTLRRSAALD
jgi:hypothetical protein